MTWLDRIEELGERLLQGQHNEMQSDHRHEREPEARDHHLIDLSTGSEFLDVM